MLSAANGTADKERAGSRATIKLTCDRAFIDARNNIDGVNDLIDKIPIKTDDIQLRHLALNSYLSRNEEGSLFSLDEAWRKCLKALDRAYDEGLFPPDQFAAIQGTHARGSELRLALLQRQITFGQFNQLRVKSAEIYESRRRMAASESKKKIEQNKLALSKALQAIGQSIFEQSTGGETQGTAHYAPTPKFTSCSWFRGTLNCLTD